MSVFKNKTEKVKEVKEVKELKYWDVNGGSVIAKRGINFNGQESLKALREATENGYCVCLDRLQKILLEILDNQKP